MSLHVYINQIFEPVVKPWILQGHDFALGEDGDSRHGKAKKKNIERKYEAENKLENVFNCASSTDPLPY